MMLMIMCAELMEDFLCYLRIEEKVEGFSILPSPHSAYDEFENYIR